MWQLLLVTWLFFSVPSVTSLIPVWMKLLKEQRAIKKQYCLLCCRCTGNCSTYTHTWFRRSSGYIHYLCYICNYFLRKLIPMQYFFQNHQHRVPGGSFWNPGGNLSMSFSWTLWSFFFFFNLIWEGKFLCGVLCWLLYQGLVVTGSYLSIGLVEWSCCVGRNFLQIYLLLPKNCHSASQH